MLDKRRLLLPRPGTDRFKISNFFFDTAHGDANVMKFLKRITHFVHPLSVNIVALYNRHYGKEVLNFHIKDTLPAGHDEPYLRHHAFGLFNGQNNLTTKRDSPDLKPMAEDRGTILSLSPREALNHREKIPVHTLVSGDLGMKGGD